VTFQKIYCVEYREEESFSVSADCFVECAENGTYCDVATGACVGE